MNSLSSSTVAPTVRTINLKPVQLTAENWKPYGQIVRPQPDDQKFDPQGDAQLNLRSGIPRFYIMHLEDRKLAFSNITHHAKVTQCLGSVGGYPWYLGVAPPSVVQSQSQDQGHLGEEAEAGNSGLQDKKAVRSKSGHFYVPPSPEDVKVFRIDGPIFVKLHVGTWHSGPYFTHDSMDFYNLELSDTNVVDHTTHSFQQKDHVTFKFDDQ